MGARKLIIGCNFEQYESLGGNFDPNRYMLFDNIDDRQVRSTAKIASQPMQSGDTISDHMYREPTTYTVSGTFSLNGKNWNDDSYDFIKKGDRLTNIQEVFEKIKDEALLCTLITIDEDAIQKNPNTQMIDNNAIVNAAFRFKKRDKMALQSISWIEQQNSLKFTFEFYQIIMVEQQEYVDLSEAERKDLGLPCVNRPNGSNLGVVLANNQDLDNIVLKTLYDRGYITNDFLRGVKEFGLDYLDYGIAAIITSFAVAVIAATISSIAAGGIAAAALGGAAAAIFPVGTIIVAAAAVVASIAIMISRIINRRKEEEKRKKAFDLVNGSPEPAALRLSNFLDDVEMQVNQIASNVTVYEIRENKEQQVILNIAGTYYQIEFKQNNTNGYGWYANISHLDGSEVTSYRGKWSPVSSMGDLNRNQNLWFKDDTKQYEVYLMNPSLAEDYNPKDEDIEVVRKRLTSYSIWVSKGDISQNIQLITNKIYDVILNYGFD